jgi:hypothetical protein
MATFDDVSGTLTGLAGEHAPESVGLPRFPDPNGRMMESAGGCAFVEETVRERQRRSIFQSSPDDEATKHHGFDLGPRREAAR